MNRKILGRSALKYGQSGRCARCGPFLASEGIDAGQGGRKMRIGGLRRERDPTTSLR